MRRENLIATRLSDEVNFSVKTLVGSMRRLCSVWRKKEGGRREVGGGRWEVGRGSREEREKGRTKRIEQKEETEEENRQPFHLENGINDIDP